MSQWLLVGFSVLVASAFLAFKQFKQNSVWNKVFTPINLPIVITVIHGWIFCLRPSSLPFSYWLFPGLVYVINVGVVLARRKSK
jgi:hypothetical protein